MNKRLPEMPNLGSEVYAPMMPVVPWKNISNIRVSKVTTHDGSFNGAVLDVKVTEEELEEFCCRQASEKVFTARWQCISGFLYECSADATQSGCDSQ